MKLPSSRLNSVAVRLCQLLAVTLLVSVATLSAAERGSLKLFTIGNSFSDYSIFYLPDLAKAGGKTLVLGRANAGGYTLERHAACLAAALADPADPKGCPYKNNLAFNLPGKATVSLPEALAAQDWDIVTIQQSSYNSCKPETFQPYADELIAAVRKYAPTAGIVVHETWAYREDDALFKKNDGFTPARMYAEVRDTYRSFADGKGFRIIPTGDAMNLARQTPRWTYVPDPKFDFKNPPVGELPDQHTSLNAGWSWPKGKDHKPLLDKKGKPVFHLDAHHTNLAGKYLGACVWYLTLFNADDVPSSFLPKGLASEDAASLRAHARAAVLAERAREAALAAAKSK